MSGQGRELGEFGLEQYTEKKTVSCPSSLQEFMEVWLFENVF